MTFTTHVMVISAMLLSIDAACYSQQPRPYRNYSSYTLYPHIPGHTVQRDLQPDCSPISMFVLARHNIRNPSANCFEKMKDKLPQMREKILSSKEGTLCQEDRDGLLNWGLHSNAHDLETLTDDGYQSAYEFGQRIKTRFPDLLDSYSDEDFLFANIYRNTSWNTAVAFAKGLFNRTDMVTDSSTSGLDPRLLTFSSVCEKQQDRYDIDEELEEFIEQEQVQTMMLRIKRRLGLTELSFGDVESMYRACSIEYAIYRRSPWCAAFDSMDLKILEYKSDMLHFQKFGPAEDINEDQTCVLTKQFLDHINNNQAMLHKGIFYFADENAVLPFLTKLGLFRDEEEMEGDSLDEIMEERWENRRWRMSSVNPFGSNFIIVLYKCVRGAGIKAFLNEREIIIPPCTSTFCSLDEMIRGLKEWADDCDFDDICDSAVIPAMSHTLFIMSCAVYLFKHLY